MGLSVILRWIWISYISTYEQSLGLSICNAIMNDSPNHDPTYLLFWGGFKSRGIPG